MLEIENRIKSALAAVKVRQSMWCDTRKKIVNKK